MVSYTFRPVAETSDLLQAPFASYWQPTAPKENAEVRAFLSTIPPGLYRRGEAFEQPRYPSGTGTQLIQNLTWQRVLTARNNDGAVAPRAAAKLAREVARPEPHVDSNGHKNCPRTGTWQPWLAPGHPLEQAVNQPWRQRWLTCGQAFPDPKRDWMLPLDSKDLKWHFLEGEAESDK